VVRGERRDLAGGGARFRARKQAEKALRQAEQPSRRQAGGRDQAGGREE
jgi:hypothetical protein